MGYGKPVRQRFWRWRGNPLRRRDDVVEAWLVLAVWTAVAVGGTTAGLVTAHAANEAFAQQRAARHSVHAILVADVPKSTPTRWSSGDKALAMVRWTASDGSTRTDRTLVDTGLKAGTVVVVWQNSLGTLITAPPSPREAAVEVSTMGAFAGLSLAGGVYALGAVAQWRLDRRRIEGWGREWDLVGPTWGHRTG